MRRLHAAEISAEEVSARSAITGAALTCLRVEIALQREVQPRTHGLVEPAQQSLLQLWRVVAIFASLVHALRYLRDDDSGGELFNHRVQIECAQLTTHRRVLRYVRGVLCLELFSELDVVTLVLCGNLIDQGKLTRQIGAQQLIQLRHEM